MHDKNKLNRAQEFTSTKESLIKLVKADNTSGSRLLVEVVDSCETCVPYNPKGICAPMQPIGSCINCGKQ